MLQEMHYANCDHDELSKEISYDETSVMQRDLLEELVYKSCHSRSI